VTQLSTKKCIFEKDIMETESP